MKMQAEEMFQMVESGAASSSAGVDVPAAEFRLPTTDGENENDDVVMDGVEAVLSNDLQAAALQPADLEASQGYPLKELLIALDNILLALSKIDARPTRDLTSEGDDVLVAEEIFRDFTLQIGPNPLKRSVLVR